MKHKILLVLLFSFMACITATAQKFNGFPAGETGESL